MTTLPSPQVEIFREVSLEEKVGQMLVVSFVGDGSDEAVRSLVVDTPIGGVIYYNASNGALDFSATRALSDKLEGYAQQKISRVPLFITVDQEGGRVQRCRGAGFTELPPAAELAYRDVPYIRGLAATAAKELRAAGVNWNLAPVVDVWKLGSKVLCGRAISSEPDEVARVAEVVLDAYADELLIGTLKHFPGHGSAGEDSHYEVPVVSKSLAELESCDLVPYQRLADKVDAIMMGHLMVPALDPDNIVTFSKKWHQYLRQTLKFEGLIITDSLVMQPVYDLAGSLQEGALRAIRAGSNLLLFGGRSLQGKPIEFIPPHEIQALHRHIVEQASMDPELRTCIEESYERIIALKKKHKLL